MTDNFNQYPLSQEILEALEGLGYKTPTGIQQEVITPMLAGKNVVVKAPTGSGKTAAFAIPICEVYGGRRMRPRRWYWSLPGNWQCRSARKCFI